MGAILEKNAYKKCSKLLEVIENLSKIWNEKGSLANIDKKLMNIAIFNLIKHLHKATQPLQKWS